MYKRSIVEFSRVWTKIWVNMLRNLIYQKHFSAKVDNIFFVPEPEAFSPKSNETVYKISVVQTDLMYCCVRVSLSPKVLV